MRVNVTNNSPRWLQLAAQGVYFEALEEALFDQGCSSPHLIALSALTVAEAAQPRVVIEEAK